MTSVDRHVERGRIRSTCRNFGPPHGFHDWDHGDAKLWCPGMDGSNPQIPKVLRTELRERQRAEEAKR